MVDCSTGKKEARWPGPGMATGGSGKRVEKVRWLITDHTLLATNSATTIGRFPVERVADDGVLDSVHSIRNFVDIVSEDFTWKAIARTVRWLGGWGPGPTHQSYRTVFL